MTAQQTNFFVSSKPTIDLPSRELLDAISVQESLGRSLKLMSIENLNLGNLIADISGMRLNARQLGQRYSYRVKSVQSAIMKVERLRGRSKRFDRCFNDLISIRAIVNDYPDVFPEYFRVADMRNGKANDDGYRGVHLYYTRDNSSYPIEIQVWSEHDARFNIWSHIHSYKRDVPAEHMKHLRELYESGRITSEDQYVEALRNE